MNTFPFGRIETSPTIEVVNQAQLAQKYARQGPRYTSYPSALHFEDITTRTPSLPTLANQQARSGAPPAPLSLYVHLPFCSDICYYCACNKVVTRDADAARRYLHYLEKEVALLACQEISARPITQLHWGGGTPTFLEDAELTRLMHLLATHFHLLDEEHREYSIEIDPRTVKEDSLALLKGLGFNRISLGIQDFDPLVQKSINRLQSYDLIERVTKSARLLQFRSLSFDLIYGLPHQDEDSITQTLRKVIALHPDRIACYNYAHLPDRFPSQRAIDRLTLPAADCKLRLHMQIRSTLEDAGYLHIGMDHFVRPDDELASAQREGRLQRNFQGYSQQLADDTLGIGCSAISQFGDFYQQNNRSLATYYESLDTGTLPLERAYQRTAEDQLRSSVIMNLACQLRVRYHEIETQYGVDFKTHFARELAALQGMAADSLIHLGENELVVSEAGRPFLRNICMAFDAYIGTNASCDGNPRYSSTV